eukprot:TRINITY_DN43640_c0_g1_i1.p1 TRINITY_DN43640_c0_g1~~TRINITY_DN43640_c0_g1_i1.p1  ORF type:complete len:400 (+),score=143.12 TRINITY_DN43640_c0_g1_i1:56-1255(+)
MSERSYSLPPSLCVKRTPTPSVGGGSEIYERTPTPRSARRSTPGDRDLDVPPPTAGLALTRRSIPPPPVANPLTAAARRAPEAVEAERRLRLQGTLKDRIYQRSFALRKMLRRTSEQGPMRLEQLLTRVGDLCNLTDEERAELQRMAVAADTDRSGTIDFKEFCTLLKLSDRRMHPEQEQREKSRFLAHGVMDPKMQRAVLKNPHAQGELALSHARPANELGRMQVDAPFGVLGDGERMGAVISSYLNMKHDHISSCLTSHDSDNDGKLTHDELRAALRCVDPYIFDQEIRSIIETSDPRRRGLVSISEFIDGAGAEYVKSKAARASAGLSGGDPLQWTTSEYSRRAVLDQLRNAPPKQLRRAPPTRAAKLRQERMHNVRDALDRREKAMIAAMPGGGQ